jgi:hypothetical protein
MKTFGKDRPILILGSLMLALLAVSILVRPPITYSKTAVVLANEGCSATSLQGTYAVHGQGTFLASVPGFPAPPFPFGEAGIATFDGTGKLFGKTTVNASGLLLNQPFTGAYTVNSDCTGSVTVQSNAGFTIQEAIVVIGGGERYVGTETDPAAVIVRTVERLREGD